MCQLKRGSLTSLVHNNLFRSLVTTTRSDFVCWIRNFQKISMTIIKQVKQIEHGFKKIDTSGTVLTSELQITNGLLIANRFYCQLVCMRTQPLFFWPFLSRNIINVLILTIESSLISFIQGLIPCVLVHSRFLVSICHMVASRKLKSMEFLRILITRYFDLVSFSYFFRARNLIFFCYNHAEKNMKNSNWKLVGIPYRRWKITNLAKFA